MQREAETALGAGGRIINNKMYYWWLHYFILGASGETLNKVLYSHA